MFGVCVGDVREVLGDAWEVFGSSPTIEVHTNCPSATLVKTQNHVLTKAQNELHGENANMRNT